MIQAPSVEGPAIEPRTVHDSGPKRGRFAPGYRTIRDIVLQRGGFAPGY